MEIDVQTWNALPSSMRKTAPDGTRLALIACEWKEVKLVKKVYLPGKRIEFVEVK